MKKSELKILEKVWCAEVDSAFSAHGIHLYQTKSKVAQKLAEEGFLNFTNTKFHGVVISGYELTHLGRMTYCSST